MWSRPTAVVPGQAAHPAVLVVIHDCSILAKERAAAPLSTRAYSLNPYPFPDPVYRIEARRVLVTAAIKSCVLAPKLRL